MQDLPDIRCQVKFPNGFSSVIYDNLDDAEQIAKVEEMKIADHIGCSPEDLKRKVELHYYMPGKPDSIKELAWSGYKFRGQKLKA